MSLKSELDLWVYRNKNACVIRRSYKIPTRVSECPVHRYRFLAFCLRWRYNLVMHCFILSSLLKYWPSFLAINEWSRRPSILLIRGRTFISLHIEQDTHIYFTLSNHIGEMLIKVNRTFLYVLHSYFVAFFPYLSRSAHHWYWAFTWCTSQIYSTVFKVEVTFILSGTTNVIFFEENKRIVCYSSQRIKYSVYYAVTTSLFSWDRNVVLWRSMKNTRAWNKTTVINGSEEYLRHLFMKHLYIHSD